MQSHSVLLHRVVYDTVGGRPPNPTLRGQKAGGGRLPCPLSF